MNTSRDYRYDLYMFVYTFCMPASLEMLPKEEEYLMKGHIGIVAITEVWRKKNWTRGTSLERLAEIATGVNLFQQKDKAILTELTSPCKNVPSRHTTLK